MRTLRRSMLGVVLMTLACSALVSSATVAQPSPSGSAGPTEQMGLTRDEAVALVLATDPRYADLTDFHRLEIERSAGFDIMFGSDYYRVLPTLPTDMAELGFISFHYPSNWLIEATLVRDCAELNDDGGPVSLDAPWPDPCEWRHSWFYRVRPDGTVSLLFDEGDSPLMPEASE